tara:strand:- start:37 stop:576 length:540 start_codon:yes stop_codon:yes gene_type:complete
MKESKINKLFIKNLKFNIKHLDTFKTFLINRGFENANIIDSQNNRLWPHWMHKFFDPSEDNALYDQNIPTLVNNRFRNWTNLKEKNSSRTVSIDPHGLIHIERAPYSIDFWLSVKNKFLPFSTNNSLKQHYHHEFNAIETIQKHDTIVLKNLTFFRTYPQNNNILFCDNAITNHGDKVA